MNIKNIAIIAHVDHGKTTLVDGLLKQSHVFRDNQKEMSQVLLMDSNDLEREKGITILAKNTSIEYQGQKINIIDTPGHADFGSEVERVLNMASGALLLVDAAEGPLPQTRFVLKKSLEAGLKIILLINKIDKKDARPVEVQREVDNLFLELAHNEDVLNFTTLYGVGRDGKVFATLPDIYKPSTPGDLTPLLDVIIKEIPNSNVNEDKPFQMLISTIDHDPYVGRLCIGKITRGRLKKGQKIALIDNESLIGTYTATKLFTTPRPLKACLSFMSKIRQSRSRSAQTRVPFPDAKESMLHHDRLEHGCIKNSKQIWDCVWRMIKPQTHLLSAAAVSCI
ncbi:MAG: GTP-binding protein TypA/BipA [Candidatus Roizmanbacteria bacterium GW2011_GWA2_37_7]|uniref:GTP-binding protein TypA/BipA n=1 Tax=Candidatus Roizmanbacteria bacterium GW2011_GWA2_37_7 TaxID=1618481 RepID=A0A0G0H7R3_9BACT|nr:MAG: GTP-binding protein TypA/BipA [Candidatus Roizmanbacteria bacterium GW2011_GWA2_37_7]